LKDKAKIATQHQQIMNEKCKVKVVLYISSGIDRSNIRIL